MKFTLAYLRFSLWGERLRLQAIGLRNIERLGVYARAGARSELARSD